MDARMDDIHRRVSRAICSPDDTDRFGLPFEVRPLVQAMLDELQCRARSTIVMDVEVRADRLWVRAILPGPLAERAIAEQILVDYQELPARFAMDIIEEWASRT